MAIEIGTINYISGVVKAVNSLGEERRLEVNDRVQGGAEFIRNMRNEFRHQFIRRFQCFIAFAQGMFHPGAVRYIHITPQNTAIRKRQAGKIHRRPALSMKPAARICASTTAGSATVVLGATVVVGAIVVVVVDVVVVVVVSVSSAGAGAERTLILPDLYAHPDDILLASWCAQKTTTTSFREHSKVPKNVSVRGTMMLAAPAKHVP